MFNIINWFKIEGVKWKLGDDLNIVIGKIGINLFFIWGFWIDFLNCDLVVNCCFSVFFCFWNDMR